MYSQFLENEPIGSGTEFGYLEFSLTYRECTFSHFKAYTF